MLEIILVIALCKNLGARVRAKGRTAWPFQTMLVFFWLGGEFAGGIVAGIMHAIRHGGAPIDTFDLSLYAIALVGAGLGAGLVYLIVALLPPITDEFDLSQQGLSATDAGMPPVDPNNPYASPRGR